MSETTTQPSLQLADIQAAVALIDIGAAEGAFKGWETVERAHGVRSRIAAFLAAVQPEPFTTTDNIV